MTYKHSPILITIARKPCLDILKQLAFTDMTHKQMCKLTHLDSFRFNHHLHNMTGNHLIVKNNGSYSISVRGMNVMKAVKQIEESEMFI